MYRKVKLFLEFPWHMKLLFVKAFLLTGYYRFMIVFVPFKRLAAKIGIDRYETIKENNFDATTVRNIRKAVLLSSKNTPWESKCLVQALTAQRLLKARKISSTVYMGLSKDEKGQLIAHAWLRVGEWIITGEKEMKDFQAVAWFGYEGK